MTVGLLINTRSGKRGDPLRDRLMKAAAQTGAAHARTHAANEAENVLADFAKSGVDTLVIYGGDGTLDHAIGIIRREKFFKTEPRIVLLPGGTTNMTYRDAGFKSRIFKDAPDKMFQSLIPGQHSPPELKRPVMRVETQGERHQYGFFFGLGAVPRAIQATRKNLHSRGMTGPASESLMIASLVKRLISGKIEGHEILRPDTLTLKADNEQEQAMTCVYLIASTLQRLLLGLKPVPYKPGTIGLTALQYPYRNLAMNISALLNARRTPGNSSGIWRSAGNSFEITAEGLWTLDGEIFDATRENPLRITMDAPVTFIIGMS